MRASLSRSQCEAGPNLIRLFNLQSKLSIEGAAFWSLGGQVLPGPCICFFPPFLFVIVFAFHAVDCVFLSHLLFLAFS